MRLPFVALAGMLTMPFAAGVAQAQSTDSNLVLPNLPLAHPVKARETSINTGPFGETIAGDHRPTLKVSQS